MNILGIAECVPYETAPSYLSSTRPDWSARTLARTAWVWDSQGSRRRHDPGCQVLRNVRMQLSSQSAIQR